MNKSVLTTILLCLCAVLGAQAQVDGGNWYNGEIVYSASQQADGKVRMHAMDEGEELEFWLIPIADKKDTYLITRDPNSQDYEYHDVVKVRHLKEKGLDVLCFYTKKNGLKTVMSNEKEWDAEKINKAKWLTQFYGDYVTEEESEFEKRLSWKSSKLTVNGTELPYDVITFNGRITDFIRIYDVEDTKNELVNEFVGTWKVIPNREGFELISVNDESDNMPIYGSPMVPSTSSAYLTTTNPKVVLTLPTTCCSMTSSLRRWTRRRSASCATRYWHTMATASSRKTCRIFLMRSLGIILLRPTTR